MLCILWGITLHYKMSNIHSAISYVPWLLLISGKSYTVRCLASVKLMQEVITVDDWVRNGAVKQVRSGEKLWKDRGGLGNVVVARYKKVLLFHKRYCLVVFHLRSVTFSKTKDYISKVERPAILRTCTYMYKLRCNINPSLLRFLIFW